MLISMKLVKSDIFFFILISIISLFFVLELFLFPGRPATFDAIFHITNIAQFSEIMKQGEFPVIWMNNFANYGLPIGVITHQTTNYLGGLLMFIINDPVTVYNLLTFVSVFLSSAFLYLFLRLYFSPLASFLGTFIFNFSPYRILNVYVRGAMPEVFASIFPPLILIALYLMIVKRKTYAFFLLILFTAGLALTHPMMLAVYSSLYIPYLLFLLITSDLSRVFKVKMFAISAIGMLLGVLISSYFVIPLTMEIKYFYYGFLIKDHLTPGNYLSLSNFLGFRWNYFTPTEIFPRGHVAQFGFVESIMLVVGLAYLIYERIFKNNKINTKILYYSLISAVLIIFFTTKYSDVFFKNIFFLNSIQFPWRFLSSLIFLPPIIMAFLYDRFPRKIIAVILISLVAYFSLPQLYGKNYNLYPVGSYFFSKENLHSIMMNTIWTGKTVDYPDKNKQGDVIEGQGKIASQTLKNSSRNYRVVADTPLRMVDRTFYFPGWNVYIDNAKTNIEFQDPNYRGVITYNVPSGNHEVKVAFEDTKIRTLGKGLSILFLSLTIILFVGRKYIRKYFFE
jgi:hypothetical protein